MEIPDSRYATAELMAIIENKVDLSLSLINFYKDHDI
jgi:hypothetical protein